MSVQYVVAGDERPVPNCRRTELGGYAAPPLRAIAGVVTDGIPAPVAVFRSGDKG
jgi:hypothetical protein